LVVIEVRTSRTPDAARGAIAIAGGPFRRSHAEFGHYNEIRINLRSLVFTRVGPTWIPRSFTGMVRADGSGTIVQGTIDSEPGQGIVIGLRIAMSFVVVVAGLFGLTQTYNVNPIPGLLLIAFGLASLIVLGASLLCRQQIQQDDENQVRVFLEDALR
jgi:hypothetical protein